MSMAEQVRFQQPQAGVSCHPAVQAWNRLNTEPSELGEISLLKKRFKSTIYRIESLGARGSSVVAKCCRKEVAAHERLIYEEILPDLPVSTPRYYGFVPGDGDSDWLFLEYVEGEPYSRERPDHSALAGRWLGLLHTSGQRAAAAARLPDRSHRHYLTQLQSARGRLSATLAHINLPPEESAVVETVLVQCNFLQAHWDQIERWCDRMPQTLVHGDFKPKNVVIRRAAAGPVLLPFDWEASGWGVPAEDLAYVDLAAYHDAVKRYCPGVTVRDVGRMKIVGRILRGLSEFCWESVKFDPSWVGSIAKLQFYKDRMHEAIEMAKWGE